MWACKAGKQPAACRRPAWQLCAKDGRLGATGLCLKVDAPCGAKFKNFVPRDFVYPFHRVLVLFSLYTAPEDFDQKAVKGLACQDGRYE
jgi:hypothetical protein